MTSSPIISLPLIRQHSIHDIYTYDDITTYYDITYYDIISRRMSSLL